MSGPINEARRRAALQAAQDNWNERMDGRRLALADSVRGDPSVCRVCRLQPNTRNNAVFECAHVDCPHRRRCWSERPDPWREPEPERPIPIERLFDKPDG